MKPDETQILKHYWHAWWIPLKGRIDVVRVQHVVHVVQCAVVHCIVRCSATQHPTWIIKIRGKAFQAVGSQRLTHHLAQIVLRVTFNVASEFNSVSSKSYVSWRLQSAFICWKYFCSSLLYPLALSLLSWDLSASGLSLLETQGLRDTGDSVSPHYRNQWRGMWI